MRRTEQIMGMPVTVELVGGDATATEAIFEHFRRVDETFSTYKTNSEISRINRGLAESQWSQEVRDVLAWCEETKRETNGYFDIRRGDGIDPSGLVKGWAIQEAAALAERMGYENYYIEAGGDLQTGGRNAASKPWRIGIRNPFIRHEVIKVVELGGGAVATSGTAIRGQHIYNPHEPGCPIHDPVSLTVVGERIFDADRFATAAFAMGRPGLAFIEVLDGLEGYMVTSDRLATVTTGFERQMINA